MSVSHTIKIKNARFYSYHGYYPEENALGNQYEVSISVQLPGLPAGNDDLTQTFNYELLYQIAKREMERPRKLLETVARAMLEAILEQGTAPQQVCVILTKTTPPFNGDLAQSEIELNWTK